MKLELRHIGSTNGRPANIIELTIMDRNDMTTLEVTDMNSKVDESLIENLREVANALEVQNFRLDEITNSSKN